MLGGQIHHLSPLNDQLACCNSVSGTTALVKDLMREKKARVLVETVIPLGNERTLAKFLAVAEQPRRARPRLPPISTLIATPSLQSVLEAEPS